NRATLQTAHFRSLGFRFGLIFISSRFIGSAFRSFAKAASKVFLSTFTLFNSGRILKIRNRNPNAVRVSAFLSGCLYLILIAYNYRILFYLQNNPLGSPAAKQPHNYNVTLLHGGRLTIPENKFKKSPTALDLVHLIE